MNNKSMDENISTWYSTYGLVTIERIFDLLGITLDQDALHTISQSPQSPYYQLLQAPLKNIFNGIIINQASDYREYAQKMLVDYLLSGAANLSEEQTKHEGARLELELMRIALIETGEKFDLLQFEHYKLINESQRTSMDLAATLPNSNVLLDEQQGTAIMQAMLPFVEQAEALSLQIKNFRKQFYETILKARDLLDSIPEYFNQLESQPEHMELLHFDANLGEEGI